MMQADDPNRQSLDGSRDPSTRTGPILNFQSDYLLRGRINHCHRPKNFNKEN